MAVARPAPSSRIALGASGSTGQVRPKSARRSADAPSQPGHSSTPTPSPPRCAACHTVSTAIGAEKPESDTVTALPAGRNRLPTMPVSSGRRPVTRATWLTAVTVGSTGRRRAKSPARSRAARVGAVPSSTKRRASSAPRPSKDTMTTRSARPTCGGLPPQASASRQVARLAAATAGRTRSRRRAMRSEGLRDDLGQGVGDDAVPELGRVAPVQEQGVPQPEPVAV